MNKIYTKKQIIEILIKYGRENENIINISNANFRGLDINMDNIKAKNIYQDNQEAEEYIYQEGQKADKIIK